MNHTNTRKSSLVANIKFQKLALLLSGLFVAQLALTAILISTQNNYNTTDPSSNLLNFDSDKISRVLIEEHDNEGKLKTLVLQFDKAKGVWVLPESKNFPASSSFMTKLLAVMHNVKTGITIGNTVESQERFRLGKDNFAHAITFYGDKPHTIYIGSAPSYKNYYLRLADSPNIYCAEIPLTFSAKIEDVFDADYAKIYPNTIKSISLPDGTVKEAGQYWIVTDANGKEHKVLIGAAMPILADTLSIPIKGLLGSEKKPEFNVDKPDLVCKIVLKTTRDNEPVEYSFSKPSDKDGYYHVLKYSESTNYLKIDDYNVVRLRDLISKLIADAEEKPHAKNEKNGTKITPQKQSK